MDATDSLPSESSTVYVIVYTPSTDKSNVWTTSFKLFLISTTISLVTSPSVTSAAVTPVKGLKVALTATV